MTPLPRARDRARLASTLLVLASFGCATAGRAPAGGPPDWNAVEESWSIELLTTDEEGGARITRAWIAVMDDHGVMRTGDTHWLHDIQRDPEVCLVIEDRTHPLHGEVVEDEAEGEQIASVMVEKYGWQKRWLMAVRPRSGGDSFIRLLPRGADDPPGCPGDVAEAP